ncbi:uncharacterized protein BT62DRAFT_1075739 [Guyanagaster necrorhizus]|uniref:F-box domain-containing protein n=1 Tax=Guyanagaster necrorhizus TaxID=856835 RepID=A0A9P7VU59_9AGAR|nr:uncharacterized protein BT62DRAFT_1075739 [Guyanagaster necrorhizus MCA 3950]KAG7447009.1 hypothetical protein BT62DRAFT_1075739 [Guyanagaster necrorhizus MCA 3950]
MSLLNFPDEILEKIVINTDLRTGSRQAIRLTCKNLCDVATPLIFEQFYINFTQMARDSSHTIRFLRELSKGRRLAKFIRALYFRMLPTDSKSNSKSLRNMLASLWKNGDTFYGTIGSLILAAVSQMDALERIHWMTMGKAVLRPKIVDQIIHSLSNRPHIRFVSISSLGIDRDIPCAPFHGLIYLTIDGGSLNYAPAIIANSPNLFRLKIIMDLFSSALFMPVLSLFGAFPEGTYSSVQQLILSGPRFSLEPTTVPALVPHLRNLSEFHMPSDFDIPHEFWIELHDAGVFLHRSIWKRCIQLDNSFLNYFGACRDLKEVHLRLGRRNAFEEQDEQRAQFFLYNIIAMNSGSLTVLLLQPEYAGYWCLDVPMLEVLSLCANLAYIGICVDEKRAKMNHDDNVVTMLLNILRRWNFLETLDLGAAIPIHTMTHPADPIEQRSVEEASVEITRCVTNYNCRHPTAQMLKLRVHTDSVYGLQLRQHELESQIYSFTSLQTSEADTRAMRCAQIIRKVERNFAITSFNAND